MYYLVTIDDGNYTKIEFKFGLWDVAKDFIEMALIHGVPEKTSVKVKYMFYEEKEQEEN